ncbi:ABC transporter permease [Allostreptomyces psammosilenae]|uniref:ABC transporter permease n=1 Tax=Allostreptomyces psammosilenae TaxID=1892865 RepID=UPI0015C90C59|nr:ABC transporter permease subunit [Allostreptomyces psammosilenae]
MFHPTVARLTWRGILGRRRGALLFVLPVVLLGLATVIRLAAGVDHSLTNSLLGSFALATIVPLLSLLAGTGAIGTEIDDGSIVYLLAKPVRRPTVVLTKLWVSIACTTLFGALPITVAGLIMSGAERGLAIGYGVGAFAAGVTYSAVFLLLGVVSRNAVVIGLLYALVWESLVGSLVDGAKTLSVQQWGLSVAADLADPGAIGADVSINTAIILLLVVTGAATWFAAHRLRSISLTGEE